MFDRGQIEEMRQGRWQLECPEMALIGRSGERVLCGYGRISNETPGRLRVTLYADQRTNEAIRQDHATDLPHSLALHARDISGTEWSAPRAVFRSLRVHGISDFREIGLELDEVQTGPAPVANGARLPPELLSQFYLQFVFPKRLGFPANERTVESCEVAGDKIGQRMKMNVATFAACGLKFGMEDLGQWTRLGVSGALDGVPAHMDTRVIEAMQFVLAQRCDWSILRISRGANEETRVRALSPWLPRPAPMVLPPPVDLIQANGEHVWDLFAHYLAYTTDRPGSEWHPVSQHLRSVLNATFSMPTESLLPLCVAVEGVLREVVPSGVQAERGLCAAIEQTRKYLQQAQQQDALGISREHCRIICRNLHRLTITNERKRDSGDRLNVLASRGVVDAEQVEAWSFFRHPLAHGEKLVGKRAMVQPANSNSVVTLLYRLIFNAIGYGGMYSDWAAPGVPLRAFLPVDLSARIAGLERSPALPAASEVAPEARANAGDGEHGAST